jgi:hypothetical protein
VLKHLATRRYEAPFVLEAVRSTLTARHAADDRECAQPNRNPDRAADKEELKAAYPASAR